jgi:hypothetical protein
MSQNHSLMWPMRGNAGTADRFSRFRLANGNSGMTKIAERDEFL